MKNNKDLINAILLKLYIIQIRLNSLSPSMKVKFEGDYYTSYIDCRERLRVILKEDTTNDDIVSELGDILLTLDKLLDTSPKYAYIDEAEFIDKAIWTGKKRYALNVFDNDEITTSWNE